MVSIKKNLSKGDPDPVSGTVAIGARSVMQRPENINDNSEIAEIIVFNTSLSNRDVLKVESYLAIKYGITLPNNYLASDGTAVYNTSSYSNNIIGIARDDNSGLLQKQSANDDRTRIYLSSLQKTNAANAGNFSNDMSYLVAGDNNKKITVNYTNTEIPATAGIYNRLDREWKISNKNFSGSFSMQIRLQNPSRITPLDLVLLVDDDGNFRDASVYTSPQVTISYDNDVIRINGITNEMVPADRTRYITIASRHAANPLPLKLLLFTTKATGNNAVHLHWETTEEINNSHFNIERSSNGEEWETIDRVKGANQPYINKYDFTDKHPLNGINYYRLKQTDRDGTYSYSPVRSARLLTATRIPIVYPNPVISHLTIDVPVTDLQTFRLYDLMGRDITTKIKLTSGSDRSSRMNMSGLPAGVYFLIIKNNTYRIVKK